MTAGNPQYVLAIDLGTGGPKVALVSTDGAIVAHEFEKNELLLLPGGGVEQDPDDWWRAITTAAKRLLSRNLVPAERIVAISCGTQWAGTVAVDRNGQHLMNAIIWLDSRGAKYVRHVTGGRIQIAGYHPVKLQRWIRLTGGAPMQSGKDSLAHILYIKHALPSIYRQTHKFLTPMDYLNARLTGQMAASYDSITEHWLTDNRDLSKVAYDDRLIAFSSIEREKLPALRPTGTILGPITPAMARELGLSEDVQVVMGTADTMAAAVGSGAVRDFEAHLYVGTSSWLSCHVPFKKTDLLHAIASLPSAIPGRYIVATEQDAAGVCLTTLKDHILFPPDELANGGPPADVFERLDCMAARVPAGSDKLIFTPWLNGERTPVDDHLVRGGFFNQSLGTTRAHLVRAVLEGVAYNTRWMHQYVERFVGRHFKAINFVGGGARSNLWCQIHADVLNRTIRQVRDPVLANVRGAGLLALLALQHLTVKDISERVEFNATYEPEPQHRKVYDQLFREFVNIYKSSKRIYARLNRAV
jgi:xylulokinase